MEERVGGKGFVVRCMKREASSGGRMFSFIQLSEGGTAVEVCLLGQFANINPAATSWSQYAALAAPQDEVLLPRMWLER